jgi:hypothetical protein
VRRLDRADGTQHETRGANTLEICSDLRSSKHLGGVNEPKTTQIGTALLQAAREGGNAGLPLWVVLRVNNNHADAPNPLALLRAPRTATWPPRRR